MDARHVFEGFGRASGLNIFTAGYAIDKVIGLQERKHRFYLIYFQITARVGNAVLFLEPHFPAEYACNSAHML